MRTVVTMNFKSIYYKIKLNYFPRFLRNNEFIYILKEQGIQIGKGTIFYGPETMQIDRSRPYLLSIGEYCKITSGVSILTHDYSRSVLRRVYGDVIGEGERTVIGNNVFIGMNSIVLMGCHIGDNVVVGAGSVLSGDIPSNVVVAGNPAKIICTLEEFYEKKRRLMLSDAKECIRAFYDYYNRLPTMKECDPFWWLFMKRDKEALLETGVFLNFGGDDRKDVINEFLKTKPMFDTFEEFISYCIEEHE